MSLFIETPQQEQLRLLREQREQLKHLRSMSEGTGVAGSAEDTSQMDRSLLDQRLFASAPTPNSTKPAGSPSAKGSLGGFNSRAWTQTVRGRIRGAVFDRSGIVCRAAEV